MDQPAPPPLRFRFFGGPVLLRGEREISLSPYQLFFLTILYGHGPHGLSRRRMVRLLWDETYDDRTRHRLRQLIYAVRQRAGVPRVVRGHQHQLLPSADPHVVECDLIDPSSPRGPPPWATFSGGFLVRLPDVLPSKAFEDWALALRARQERLAEAVAEVGPPRSGATAGPVPEPDHPAPPRPSPLVGRDVELRAAWDAVTRRAEGWRTVVVSGDAGIGKTRLVDELTARLRRSGRPVVRADCHEAEREVSFNLMAELCETPPLRDAIRGLEEPWRSIVRTAFPAALASDGAVEKSEVRRPVTSPRVVLDALEHLFVVAVPPGGLTIL
ncbi:MAG TPA: AAA family ATPase, partial [Longimicrobiales bacterium]|nr:AAA family ATPase [Longimicrobiales bacterium]